MAKKFSVLSWNVEHFKLKSKDVPAILAHIKAHDPDVIAIYEVEGKDVYDHMVQAFPGYNFHITEGEQTQEILLGVRGTFTAFYTQRTEFKTGNDFLRPGAMLSLRIGGDDYCMLFLHTKSFPAPVGFGTRDSQFEHAFNLKKALDGRAGGAGKSKFIVVGDLNTMGMDYPFKKNITPEVELQKLERDAAKKKMRFLKKDYDRTWTDGKRFSNLDHVLASTSLQFRQWGPSGDIKVSGWREHYSGHDGDGGSTAQEFRTFVRKVSDHNSLYFEVL